MAETGADGEGEIGEDAGVEDGEARGKETGRGETDDEKRFLADLMLIRLARWLRLLGQDVALPSSQRDGDLMHQAAQEGRTVITRDRGLSQSCQRAGVNCILISSSDICGQLEEVAAVGVPLRLDPKRCTVCNGLLDEVKQQQGQMWQCRDCRKLYWKGGHWKGIRKRLAELQRK
jgi:uncharacterized protein with PIN domain